MKVGDKVDRIENAEVTEATIMEIDGENVLIAYDEGGQGWWPINALQEK